ILRSMDEDPGQVVDVNPGHPLPATPEWTAQTHAERKNQFLYGASFGAEHDANPHAYHADAKFSGGQCLTFPRNADIGEKVVSRRCTFVENFIAAIAVITDCRGRNQNARWGRQLAQGFD